MKVVNYRNTPYLRLIIPFCTGLFLGDQFPGIASGYEIGLALAGILLLFLAAGLRYEYAARWLFGGLLQCSLIAAGYYYLQHNDERNAPHHFSHSLPEGQKTVLTGIVYDAPVQGNKLKVLLRTETYYPDSGGVAQPVSGNLLLYINTDSSFAPLRYGDQLAIQARVRPVEAALNPHSFDYRNYLHHQDIHYSAYLYPSEVKVLSREHGNWIWAQAFTYRDRLLGLLQTYFTTQDEYAVASALLVGYKEDLSDEIRQAYADTGSMHALAVSGTHVGLLYMGLLFLLQRLPLYGRKGRIIETLLALLAIWAFTFLTGATASVLRASVMFSFFLVGKMVFRQANIWNVLSASAFGLLLYNPHFLFDAGFQLSYAAVAGMAFFYPMMYKVSPVFRYKWLNEGWSVLLIGITAQIGTLPLSLYYFHQFPCYFWLAGWVVVLGGAVFLWAGALLIVLDWAVPFLAQWLGIALSWMLFMMNKIIFLIQSIPGSVVSGIWLSAGGVVLLYLVIASMGAGAALRQKSGVFAAVAGLLILLSANAFRGVAQVDQFQLCSYYVNKGSLLDIFDGRNRLTLRENVSPKQETFAAQGHRWACGVTHQIQEANMPFGRDTTVGQITVKGNLIQAGPYRIGVVDKGLLPTRDTALHFPVDIILLKNSAPVSLRECLRVFPARAIIADGSNARKQVYKWEREAKDLNIELRRVLVLE